MNRHCWRPRLACSRERRQHIDPRAAESKAAPGGHGFDGNVELRGFGQESLVGRDLRIGAHPQHPGTKVTQEGRHPAHVIAVCVTESDSVEAANVKRPQHRRDHIFPDFKVAAGRLRAAASRAARVDQQCFPFWGDQQHRISLAHIDGCHLEHAGW